MCKDNANEWKSKIKRVLILFSRVQRIFTEGRVVQVNSKIQQECAFYEKRQQYMMLVSTYRNRPILAKNYSQYQLQSSYGITLFM